MSLRRGKRLAWVVLAVILGALGASDPEVVQVRVSAAKVSAFFPAGTDLEVLPPEKFAELLRAVRDRSGPANPSRILRARHSAKLDQGVLIGRSELAIEPSNATGPSLVILDPWSPSLDPSRTGTKAFRATSDGRLAVKVEPSGPRIVEADWRLIARPGSEGRAFLLSLPDLDVSSLVLDLPSGWVPEAKAGPRVGPEPGSSPDRSAWRFEAARGTIDLRLANPSDPAGKPGDSGLWVEGTTRVDLNESPTNWRAEWMLDQSPGAHQELKVELDPGLELVEVAGPRVASFREGPEGSKTRVTIKLDGEGPGRSPLTIRAICHAPVEGAWIVPWARPIDATWTGGRTLVTLDASRVLQSCSERSGRRVPPRATDPAEPSTLIFESKEGAGPVVELTLRKPLADATLDIRGHLLLGDQVPRFDVALTWTVERGRILTHAVDLSPGWTPDRVLSILNQPVPWHAERLSNGGTRVQIGPSLPDENALMLTLTLSASAWKAGVTGPLDLPRVRPAPGGIRVVDEIWAATPDPKLVLRPILGSGLAWIDPLDPPLDDAPAPWVADDLRNALAWRWLADDAEARINRTLPTDRPQAEVELNASIVRGKLGLNWSLAVESDLGDLRTIPIHLDEPIETPIRWRSRDPGGPIIEARPIDPTRRAKLGFPTTGSAWDLELSGSGRGRIQLEAAIDRPWEGRGMIPILTLPEQFRTRGLLKVIVDDSTRLKVTANGLTPIETPRNLTNLEGGQAGSDGSQTRQAALFAYRSAGGRLEVETTGRADLHAPGVIRESFLVSQAFPGAGMRHRLTLSVADLTGRSITLKMPANAEVDRIRRDGQPVVPTQSGEAFRVEIPEPSGNRLDTTLTIDYRTSTDLQAGPISPASLLPDCSLPCLSFVWDIVAPDHWVIADNLVGLNPTDPQPARSVTTRLLGFRSDLWSRPDRSASPPDSTVTAIFAELDQVASGFSEGESNLGDWLLKLDSGRWPLVIDRLALRSNGLGPGSRIGPSSPESRMSGPLNGVLQSLGLVASPLGGLVLITSKGEVPDHPDERSAWASALKVVPWQGSDPTDRFQSPGRWRGESSPRARAASESLERSPGPIGWHSRRMVSTGWPSPSASASLVDARFEQARGWVVASLLLFAGILTRKRSAKARAVILFLLGLGTSAALAWTWADPPTWASGCFRGLLALGAFWVGHSFRLGTSTVMEPAREGSTRSRRSGLSAGVVISGLVVAAIVGGLAIASASSIEGDPPILALLVFDGVPDATSKPDRVVLSLKDAGRLRQLAEPESPARSPVVSLSAASHRVIRDDPRQATVESRYEVEVESASETEPARWIMPVGPARDLSATVDDRASPLRISTDGLSAIVSLDKPGLHAIVFRRSLPLHDFGTMGQRFTLPVNRAAFAGVAVEPGPEPERVEIPSPSGPFGNLEVRWSPVNESPASGIEGPVEAVFLWDARPVGDLIRLRMTHGDPDGVSTIRLALEPGLIVRGYAIPNVVSIRQEGTSEWVARVDPPLPRETPIEVDLWRAARPGEVERRWPKIEVKAAGKVNTLLGFRRPGDWSGWLEAGPEPGIEAVSDANFLKAWGGFDIDGLIFSGAIRFSSPPALAIATRPVPLRRSIASKVQVELVPGRLNLAIDATLSDRQGRSFDLEVGLPNELRLIKVEAIGLIDWQKPARDRLRLQFDGSEVADRRIRIEGYLPVPSDSVMSEARTYLTRIPWPRWSDAETPSGTLSVSGSTRFQVEAGDGVVVLPNVGPVDPDAPFRGTYRVDRPAGLSTIRWSAPTARFAVSVQSDLTIDPGSIHWTAVVLCDIAGGPADSLQWNIPTDWARNATLEIEGYPHHLVAEPKGARGEITQWSILPESKLWGRVKLILRSKRPVEPGVLFIYPELAPRAAAGRGSVERYEVAITNVSGREVKLEGSKGLQPLDLGRFRSEDSFGLLGSIDQAFQVTAGRWSLGVRIGRSGESGVLSGESRPSRVGLATIRATVGEDGEVWGRARYDLEAGSDPFFGFELPEPAEIPWASVDGLIQPVLDDGPGRWLVPLGDRQARLVDLLWHRPKLKLPIGPTEILAIPQLPTKGTPTLVAIFGPGSLAFTPSGSAFSKLVRISWEIEFGALMAQRVTGSLDDFDRNSPRERERVVDEIVELELQERAIARRPTTSSGLNDSAIERIRAVISSIDEASENTGLDNLFQEAQARVGLARAFEDPSLTTRANVAELIRTRRIGQASYFRSRDEDSARSPGFTMNWNDPTARSNSLERWGIVGAGAMIFLISARLIASKPGRTGRRFWLLATLILGLMLVWEPLGTVALVGFVGWGRRLA